MNENEGRGTLGLRLLLGQTDREPRVIQMVQCEDTFYRYLRVSCKLSTFLQQDVVELMDEDEPLEPDQGVNAVHNEVDDTDRYRYVRLQHPKLAWSGLALHPEVDILWLRWDSMAMSIDELRHHYGRQLDHFKNVIVEEVGFWGGDLDKALEMMEPFRNIQIVNVWLETNRHNDSDLPLRTKEELRQRAREFLERDRPALSGRNWVVNYIDDEGNIHGGFRANQSLPWRVRRKRKR